MLFSRCGKPFEEGYARFDFLLAALCDNHTGTLLYRISFSAANF